MAQRHNGVSGEHSEALSRARFKIVLNLIKAKFIQATGQKLTTSQRLWCFQNCWILKQKVASLQNIIMAEDNSLKPQVLHTVTPVGSSIQCENLFWLVFSPHLEKLNKTFINPTSGTEASQLADLIMKPDRFPTHRTGWSPAEQISPTSF